MLCDERSVEAGSATVRSERGSKAVAIATNVFMEVSAAAVPCVHDWIAARLPSGEVMERKGPEWLTLQTVYEKIKATK